MKYKGILIDLDDTLYDYSYSHNVAFNEVKILLIKNGFSNINFEKSYKISRSYINKRLFGTAASHNRLLYFQIFCEKNELNPFKYAPLLYDTYWNTFLKNMHIRKNAIKFLDFCITRKIKSCLITDLTAHIQYRKVKKLNLLDRFNFIVTSEESGIEKPDITIFKLALDKLGLDKSDVCMIGDSYKKDIMGAKSFGIKSYWFRDFNDDSTQNNSITSFNDFKQLIGEFNE